MPKKLLVKGIYIIDKPLMEGTNQIEKSHNFNVATHEKKEREGDRQGQRQIHRETDTQRDNETERHIERDRER